MARALYPTRRTTLAQKGKEDDLARTTAAERIAMVWPITLQAWQFKEPLHDEPRLRRDVVRTVRGRR